MDVWFVEPEPDSDLEEDSDASDEIPSIDAARKQFAAAAESYLNSDEEEAEEAMQEVKPISRKAKKEKMNLDLEESKKRRQFEQENNPYYVKSIKKEKPTSTLLNANHKVKPSKQPDIQDLQSPLEIPGVIGLDRYMQQQESTLSWKTAKETKKKPKTKRKKGKKGKKPNLSVLSSSEDEDVAVVVHQVNRDDGEMPENALSSGDEADLVSFYSNFDETDINVYIYFFRMEFQMNSKLWIWTSMLL